MLSQCELKLSKLLSMTNMDGQTKKIRQQTEEYQEKMLQKSQSDIRIRLGDQDNDGPPFFGVVCRLCGRYEVFRT